MEARFWAKVNKKGPFSEICCGNCWIWMGHIHKRLGYGGFGVGVGEDKWKCVGAHRFAWVLFNGSIVGKFDVHHKCRVRSCVNPDHLELKTRKAHSKEWSGERNGQRTRPDRAAIGSRAGNSVLDEWQACGVMAMYLQGFTKDEIATCYGISNVGVQMICYGRSWKWLFQEGT